jgi:hypothetical protein
MEKPYFIHSFPSSENILYHTIINPDTKKACYPDILIKHNFTEKEIADTSLYEIAEAAIKKYGSSRCYFVAYKDEEALCELIKIIDVIYEEPFTNNDSEALINNMAELLMLSATMTASLKTLLTYYGDFVGDLKALVNECTKEYKLPVSNKNEGKKIYELIRQKILG